MKTCGTDGFPGATCLINLNVRVLRKQGPIFLLTDCNEEKRDDAGSQSIQRL